MLHEQFGLNDCEIQGDFWKIATKREPGIVDVGVL